MSSFLGPDYGTVKGLARTAKDLLTLYPETAGKDGYYQLYPQGRSSTGQLVYCDMTTDGGGWMLFARSHPSTVNYAGQNWGWRGGPIGKVNDFSQAYQLGWWTYWEGNSTFTEYAFGNRSNINNNSWGYFIYKVAIPEYSTFMTSNTQQSPSSTSTLKSDTSVYGSTAFPGMQGAIGYASSGTSSNFYYMRDCCGFAGYGAYATNMTTTYCGSTSVVHYSGPWCGGSSRDGSGNFLSGSYTAGGYVYGGTNQYMIMVR